MAKLTLHVPDELVVAAKGEAASRHVSVSKLVSDFFATLASKGSDSHMDIDKLAPRTRRLSACISPDNADIEDYIDHLESKHS